MSYTDDELPVEPDFDIPDNHNFVLSPDELLLKMGQCAYEFSEANRRMRKLEVTKSIREKKLRIILLARRIDLITNAALKHHLEAMFADPKFKWIGADLDAAIYIEQEQVMSEYARYEKLAKQAEKEHAMWQGHLIYYQSKKKHESLQNYEP